MKASSDNNDFRARGWGWLGSLETGLPFSITDNLMLEPQLQYTWQGLSLDDGQDNAGYVKFGHGSTQHVRAGFRLGSHNDMTFGEGTSSRDTLRDSTKHRVSELPVNWWVQPSVTRCCRVTSGSSVRTDASVVSLWGKCVFRIGEMWWTESLKGLTRWWACLTG